MSILPTDRPRDAEPLLVKPAEAGRLLGCGRTRIYELINAGEIDSFSDGRSRKITVASIRAYVARRLAADSATSRATLQAEPGLRSSRRQKKCRVSAMTHRAQAVKALGRIGIHSDVAGRRLT
jgi:excisionase family DNA binding protein